MSDTNLNDANFTPTIPDSEESTNKQTYSATGSFRFWCQKVLPLVYDDSLSYYELLCKVVNYLNSVIQNVDNLNTSVDNTNTAFNNLQNYVNTTKDTLVEVYDKLEQYVNDYFNNLDVQEEINAKLDAMASDGSLSELLTPLITSKVSAWLSENITPTSPAVDASLSVSGAAADAKVTGDEINNIKDKSAELNVAISELDKGKRTLSYVWGNIATNGTIDYNFTPKSRIVTADYEKFEEATTLTLEQGYNLILATYNDDLTLLNRNIYPGGQVITVPANTLYRACVYHNTLVPSAISDFSDKLTYESNIQKEINVTSDEINNIKNKIAELNIAIPELDAGKRILSYVWGNIAPNGTIDYNFTPKSRIVTADYEKFEEATTLTLEQGYNLILATYNDDLTLLNRRIYTSSSVITVPANTLYRACVYHDTIVPSAISDFSDKLTYESNIQKEINTALSAALSITNGGIELTTVNDLATVAETLISADRRVGFFRYNSNSINAPTSSSGFVIIYRGGIEYQTQIAMPTTGGLYARNRLNAIWNEWVRIDSSNKVYHVEKDGSGDFTSLVDCINEATQYMNSKVYVGAGEWDICAELGETYLNEVSAEHGKRGLYLKNNIHVIFSSNSKVICNYTGDREDTMRWLSAFNAGQYGFTLENANIEGANIRYCVHDERDSDADAYTNKYINCKMYLNNNTNTIVRTCNPIGGGLGKNGYIVIDGCWLKGERTSVYTENLPLVTYHNSASANAKSHISVKNTYLADDGRFRFNWYGQSQLITDVEVSGCSMGTSILSQAEVEGSSPYQNISIVEWNNTIRS